MSTYAAYLAQLSRINPVDYQDAGTQAHLAALALPLDELTARARAVMLARLIRFAPEDALLMLGTERGLKRFPGEPLEVFRTRVLGAWAYWQQAGTLPGMVNALAAAGYRAVVIEHQMADPDPVRWAEFSIRVGPLEKLPSSTQWDSGSAWDAGKYWDFQLPAVPLDYLPELIRAMKPAHARLRRLVFSPRGRFWDGDATWDEGRDTQTAEPFTGYGLNTGVYEGVLTTEQTDSGFVWDAAEDTVIYDIRGNYDAQID